MPLNSSFSFFSQSKLTSFQRQLSLYGFARLTKGKDQGAYYHELFLRGRPDLIHKIVRTRVKGTGCKAPSSPETEPNFYAMKHCALHPTIPLPSQVPSSNATTVSDIQSTESEDKESNKDDESTAMSDVVDEFSTGASLEGVYTNGSPFDARMELFLPHDFNIHPMPEEHNAPVGPLMLPGRLRNAVRQEEGSTKVKVVKFIPMDLSQRTKARLEQWTRWAEPLKNDISTKLLPEEEESSWSSAATSTAEKHVEPPALMASLFQGMSTALPLLPALPDCGQQEGPTLEDIIYMI